MPTAGDGGDGGGCIRCCRRRGHAPQLSRRSVQEGLNVLDIALRMQLLPPMPPSRRPTRRFSVGIHGMFD